VLTKSVLLQRNAWDGCDAWAGPESNPAIEGVSLGLLCLGLKLGVATGHCANGILISWYQCRYNLVRYWKYCGKSEVL
jgi:hypothetical protein